MTCAFHDTDPAGQLWARAMADTLLAAIARAAGQDALDEPTLTRIRCAPTAARSPGLADNRGRRGGLAHDVLTLARRFRDHEDMILRFATDLTVAFTSNQAERDVRPVKVQQCSSGGCWRTLDGLADFAVVQSYLATAAKRSLDKLDALRQLFTTGLWTPDYRSS